jgi:hypothetical protein
MTEGEATSHGHTFREGPTFLIRSLLATEYTAVEKQKTVVSRDTRVDLSVGAPASGSRGTRAAAADAGRREAQAQTYRLSVVCVFDV